MINFDRNGSSISFPGSEVPSIALLTKRGGRLKENEMTQLCRFGAGFGFGDQTTQLNMLRQYEQLLVEEAEQAALKQRDTTRIYNTMGVLSGILIVLMLL